MSLNQQDTAKIKIPLLGDECYRRIKNDILTGHLAWGEKLNVIQLASQYGISRSPVVKAIDRLAMEGLIKIVPNKGSFVLIPTAQDITEATEVRKMIETSLCQLAFAKNRNDLITDLTQLNMAMEKRLQIPTDLGYEEYLENDRDFHYTICRYAENNRMTQIYNSIRCQIELFRIHTFGDKNIKMAIEKHVLIVQKLADHDIDGAIEALLLHIKEVGEETQQSLLLVQDKYTYQ